MSRVKTYKITKEDLTRIMSSLKLNRADISRICKDVSPSAYGWWLHSHQIPVVHLTSLYQEHIRQSQLRTLTEDDRKVADYFKTALEVLGATGTAIVSNKSAISFNREVKGSAKKKKIDLSKVETEDLFMELKRRLQPRFRS